ncbi:fibronectin type III domain-containing protein [Chitinophaga varians]|uniref:fibronectin type III domain-containing protein n=1 Tax=Chitinophaga varians TaxID=2202339 RepID=UPI00165FF050|nr:fibronectin type III domain-containing protein [Chitinophaga varians]MBC9909886.1 fibronectin type III domain-containing protein [Chitinophaga varians]
MRDTQIARIIRPLFSLMLLLLLRLTVAGQQYPVTASTQIIPPYSVYLPDYVVPGSDKMRVILVQNDLTKPSYDVILQMTIEQNGTVIMRTAQHFVPKPLTLMAGVPTIISSTDLADYLHSDNITFTGGFSRDVYEKNKSLPEGAYRITFTAYDYRRQTVQVSNPGANIFYFRKNDPPLLNLPVCGSRVEKRDPQFLTFSWSSRNTSGVVAGNITEYVFSLYEIKPKGSNPDYIIRSTRPIYTVTTQNTTIPYGPGEPALTDSMEYAWIVQAKDQSGRDAYSNQGYSLSCKFTYLGTNPFEINHIAKPTLSGKSTGERSIRLSWPLAANDARYQVDAYRVQYRAAAKNGVEYDWHAEEKTNDTLLNVRSLEPGRTYEARLQWRVAGVYGPFSEVVTLTTDAPRTFTCGDANSLQAPQNTQPQPSLSAGMIVKIGHFDVMLTEVSGGDGLFSGKGKVITAGFGTGLALEFKKITINTDLVVIRGEMQAITEGIDKFTEDGIKHERGGDEVGQVVTGDVVPDIVTKLHVFTKDNIVVDTDKGTITLTDSETGKQEVIDYKAKNKTLPITLEDTDGNLYNIDKNGKVTEAGKRDKSLAGNPAALEALKTLDLSKAKVIFTAAAGNKYAFDSWKQDYYGKPVLDKSYEVLADGAYRVSAKAIVPGEQEKVTATLTVTDNSIDTATLKFVNGKGIVYPSTHNGNVYTITVTGGPAGDAQEIYAVCAVKSKPVSIGKLLVASYAPKQRKVVLVPVGKNGWAPEREIRSALEKSYAGVGVTYTITVDDSFRSNTSWDLNGDSLLQDSKSAALSNSFTGEEKMLCRAYRKSHQIDDDAVYLFLVNEVALKDGDLIGKMPRQSQYGFLFTKDQSPENVARAVSHEIGHGAFTLEHTFSAGITLPKGTTDNLMDYSNGYTLLKYQWDVVHDPGHVWGLLENDADQESVGYSDMKVFDPLNNTPGRTYTFITPGGTYITLPPAAKNLRFSTLDRTFFLRHGAPDNEKPTEELVPLGALVSFEISDSNYSARFDGNTFQGYKVKNGSFYEDTITITRKPEDAIAVLLGVKDGAFVTYASRFSTGHNTTALTAPYRGSSTRYNDFSVVHLDLSKDKQSFVESIGEQQKGAPLLTLPANDLFFANQDVPFTIGDKTKASVKDLLLTLLTKESPVKDYLTFYTLANLKASDLANVKSCLEPAVWQATVRTRLKELIFNENVGHNTATDLFYNQLQQRVEEELKKFSVDGNKLVADLHAAVLAKKGQDEIHTILVGNYASCGFSLLPISDRLYILGQLLSKEGSNNNWYTDPKWYSSNDGAFIVGDLVKTTPEDGRVKLLKDGFKANNYQWLRKLLDHSTTWFNGVGYDDVHDVADVVANWVGIYRDQLGITPTQRSFQDEIFGVPPFTYYPGETEFPLGFKSNNVYTIRGGLREDAIEYNVGPYMTSKVEFLSTGKIHMAENYYRKVIPLTISAPNTRLEWPQQYINYDEEYDPFESVVLTAAIHLPEIGFDEGQQIAVPAYMAWLYHRDFKRAVSARNTRTVVNILNISAALFLAPESGGGSLALLTQLTTDVAGVVSAADVYVQAEKNRLSSEGLLVDKEYYAGWDKIVATTNYINMGVGGLNLSVSAYTKFRQLSGTLSEARRLLEGAPLTYKNLRTAWASAKAGRLLEEALEAASRRTAIELANEAIELRKRSILIAGEDLKHVGTWMKGANPNTVYIVVHGEGDVFKVMANGVDKTLTAETLGDWIIAQKIPADRDIVLLSCADIETAKKLSSQINRNLIANHGWVDLAENGAVAGEHPFMEVTPQGTATEVAAGRVSTRALSGATVRLGATRSTVNNFVSQITDKTVMHVIYGEVKLTVSVPGRGVVFRNSYRGDMIWEDLKNDFVTNPALRGLPPGFTVEYKLGGIHSMRTVLQNPESYRYTIANSSIGQIAGQDVAQIRPEVYVPDMTTILTNNRWNTTGIWIRKPGNMSTMFPASFTENQILGYISDAFRTAGSPASGAAFPALNIQGTNVTIRVVVISPSSGILTSFIESVP